MNDEQKEVVKNLLQEIKNNSFTPEYRDKATDEEAMGLLISKYFEWNGIAILETASSALEDANFHTECEKVEDMLEGLKFNK